MTFPTEEAAREFLKQYGVMEPMPIAIPSTHGRWVLAAPGALEKPSKTCSICCEQYHEFGNNAEPVNDGRCCNYCDDSVVIPARIALAEMNR